MVKIFVYGTLRQGMYNYDIYLKDEKSFREYAYLKGSLYTIQGKTYPAYLTKGNQYILGEIHEVSEEKAKELDEMEGYHGENHESNEYHRILCPIYNEQHEVITPMPVYVYNTDNINNAPIGECIESGDFVSYVKAHKGL